MLNYYKFVYDTKNNALFDFVMQVKFLGRIAKVFSLVGRDRTIFIYACFDVLFSDCIKAFGKVLEPKCSCPV